jgi:WD40 repeat protein
VFTPDGKLVTGAGDGVIRLWDPATAKEVRRLRGHEGAVLSLALSADGRTLASGGQDRTVRVWDLASGKELRRHQEHRLEVAALAISPDGKRLVSADGSRGDFRGHRALIPT